MPDRELKCSVPQQDFHNPMSTARDIPLFCLNKRFISSLLYVRIAELLFASLVRTVEPLSSKK
ncbi:hypothetical protein NITHO_6470002 [Nitrolancea hollandica Lb]|uniref:Uncharacterized protein n=1 Tax=Nitrolancea hollandica Lb TaxID=1129897 RepID=I4EMS3_9BACT|nr:hypothetical protein NITHO_6470002 [Nitrolancea hollandica Lb]